MDGRMKRLLLKAGFLSLLAVMLMTCSSDLDILEAVKTQVMVATDKFLLIHEVGPAANSTVNPGTAITVVFDRVIDPASISGTSIAFDPPADFTWSYKAATKTLTVTPSSLNGNTTYTISVTLRVKGSDGSALQTPYSWSFTTQDVPYGTFTINNLDSGPAGYTRQRDVQLAIFANFQTYQMRWREGAFPDGDDTGWVTKDISKPFTVSTGDGAKAIFMQFANSDGSVKTTPISRTITLDATPPSVSIGALSPLTMAAPTATAVATASDANGITAYSWAKSLGPGTVTFGSAAAASTTVKTATDGTYGVTVTVTDSAGNTTTSSAASIVRDATAPSVSAGSAKLLTAASPSSTMSGSASDANGIASYSWTGAGLTFGTPAAASTTVGASGDGSYTATLAATDTYGNTSSATASVKKDTAVPVVSAGGSKVWKNGTTSMTLSGSASDANLTGVQWTGTGLSFGSPTSVTTTVTPNTVDGVYTATLTATDVVGNTTSSSATITRDITPPTVSAGSSKVLNVAASTATLGGSASDTYGIASYAWTGTGLSFGSPSAATSTVSAAADGSYTATLTVTDGSGNTNSSSVSVVRDQTPPTVSAGGTQYINSTTSSRSIGSASDASGIASYSWSGVTAGLSLSSTTTAPVTASIAGAEGTYYATLTVVDGCGNIASSTATVIKDITLPGAPAFSVVETTPSPSLLFNEPVWTWASGGGGGAGFAIQLQLSGKPIWEDKFKSNVLHFPPDTTYVSTLRSRGVYPLKDGSYRLFIREVDAAGNYSADDGKSGAMSVAVGTYKYPYFPYTGSTLNSATVDFQWPVNTSAASYVLSLTNESKVVTTTYANAFPWYTVTLPGSGYKWSWYVTAKDAKGGTLAVYPTKPATFIY